MLNEFDRQSKQKEECDTSVYAKSGECAFKKYKKDQKSKNMVQQVAECDKVGQGFIIRHDCQRSDDKEDYEKRYFE